MSGCIWMACTREKGGGGLEGFTEHQESEFHGHRQRKNCLKGLELVLHLATSVAERVTP